MKYNALSASLAHFKVLLSVLKTAYAPVQRQMKLQASLLRQRGVVMVAIVFLTALANIISFSITIMGFGALEVEYHGSSLPAWGIAFVIQSLLFLSLYMLETRQVSVVFRLERSSSSLLWNARNAMKIIGFSSGIIFLMLLSVGMNFIGLADARHGKNEDGKLYAAVEQNIKNIVSVNSDAVRKYAGYIGNAKGVLRKDAYENCICECEPKYKKYKQILSKFSPLNSYIQNFEFEEINSISKLSIVVGQWSTDVGVSPSGIKKGALPTYSNLAEAIVEYNALYSKFLSETHILNDLFVNADNTFGYKMDDIGVVWKLSEDGKRSSCLDKDEYKGSKVSQFEKNNAAYQPINDITEFHLSILRMSGEMGGINKSELLSYSHRDMLMYFAEEGILSKLKLELLISCLFEISYIFMVVLARVYTPSPSAQNELIRSYAERYEELRELHRKIIRGRLQEVLHSRILRDIDRMDKGE